ncbi:hypothetical protein RhiirA4_487558 [Rhizophagus irregularis]|uniref:Uncharacterized protein n=1 Tax=Rhizophagus irregularis TaxID=588596 RepID=A0A2I1HSN8_9GLOM|nr:hypothetical protein RhiirA4_487558 [Rhizophagus irregularis]
MDEITIGEWHQTLELVNTNSAPAGREYKREHCSTKVETSSTRKPIIEDQYKTGTQPLLLEKRDLSISSPTYS